MYPKRLLFASIHFYIASSSGVALCTRELLEAPAARGAARRVLSMGVLDYRQEVSLDEVLAGLGLPGQRFEAALAREGTAEVIDLTVNGVRVTLLPTSSTPARALARPARVGAAPRSGRPGAGAVPASGASDLRRAPRQRT